MTNLVEFLRARLDDDKRGADAAAARSGNWSSDGHGVGGGEITPAEPECGIRQLAEHCIVSYEGWPEDSEALHIARHDPARVLREVESKRRIIDLAEDISRSGAEFAEQDYETLTRALAAVYSDHPDYREEWAL